MVRCDLPDGPIVLKEWNPPHGWFHRGIARFLIRREVRNYARLAGVAGVPRFLASYGSVAFAVEYVDGEPPSTDLAQRDPGRIRRALDSLESVVASLHGRRFCHLDLRHRRNVVIDAAGDTWIVDLAQGVPCARWPLRWLFPVLARADRSAILKYRARYAPETLEPRDRARLVARYGRRRRRPLLAGMKRAVATRLLR